MPFAIERASRDKREFERLWPPSIQPRGVGGNGSVYRFIDDRVRLQKVYRYRLVELDSDGNANVLAVRTLKPARRRQRSPSSRGAIPLSRVEAGSGHRIMPRAGSRSTAPQDETTTSTGETPRVRETAWSDTAPMSSADPASGPKASLRGLALQSIAHGLSHQRELAVDPADHPESWRVPGACFITLRIDGRLRGCTGSLEATRPLVIDVVKKVRAEG